MKLGRIPAWQALLSSSSPPSAAGARDSHTRIVQDPQAFLLLGPMPLKCQPQQPLEVWAQPSPTWPESRDFQRRFCTSSFPGGIVYLYECWGAGIRRGGGLLVLKFRLLRIQDIQRGKRSSQARPRTLTTDFLEKAASILEGRPV